MLRQPSCQDCRWFSLLREGAVIGRCRNDAGGLGFPRREACCPQFDSDRSAERTLAAPRPFLMTGPVRRA